MNSDNHTSIEISSFWLLIIVCSVIYFIYWLLKPVLGSINDNAGIVCVFAPIIFIAFDIVILICRFKKIENHIKILSLLERVILILSVIAATFGITMFLFGVFKGFPETFTDKLPANESPVIVKSIIPVMKYLAPVQFILCCLTIGQDVKKRFPSFWQALFNASLMMIIPLFFCYVNHCFQEENTLRIAITVEIIAFVLGIYMK